MEFLIAETSEDFETGKRLFLEYAGQLEIDLSFQNFEEELSSMITQYGPPAGGLILMKENDEIIGCVGIRKLEEGIGEVKRMFIKKDYRGRGLGKPLLAEGIALARSLHYKSLRLDTLPAMKTAIKLYTDAGFREIKPYRYNPVADTKYFELVL